MLKFQPNTEIVLKEIRSIADFMNNGFSAENCIFQGIDFTQLNPDWEKIKIENTVFLGCNLTKSEEISLMQRGAYVYVRPDNLLYDPFRTQLYTCKELMEGFSEEQDNSYDFKIYQQFSKYRLNPPIQEALWQRIHDYSIDHALRDLLQFDHQGMTQKKCVGFMGGHGTLRTDPYYEKTALTAKLFTEAGYFVVSGGGPGIMEAANLGAYFAGRPKRDLDNALRILSAAPHYTDKCYHRQTNKVIEKYPKGQISLAIPTWFYGHEPSNLFSTHIAKYFSNSIREDTLLAVCLYGVVFAPGSAGTTQEIFQEATQNHYGTFNYYSPMVFLSREQYEVNTLIYPLLRQLAWGKEYYHMLHLTDEPKDVLKFVQSHPPVKCG